MNSSFKLLNELHPDRDDSIIKVRIVRRWTSNGFLKNTPGNTNVILMDQKLKKIHATISKELAHKFDKCIIEGMVICIKNFEVRLNYDNKKYVRNLYSMKFLETTEVTTCDDIIGSKYGLKFSKFEEILDVDFNNLYFVDIIGGVISHETLENTIEDGEKKLSLSLIIEDSFGLRIKCILFDDMAKQMSTYLISSHKSYVIMVLQLASITKHNGVPVIKASDKACKVFTFSDHFGPIDTRDRLMLHFGSVGYKSSVHECKYDSLLQFDTFDDCQIISISDLKKMKLFDQVVIVATVGFIPTDQLWYSIQCVNCGEEVKLTDLYMDTVDIIDALRDNNMWFCCSCKKEGVPINPRYNVQLRIVDATGVIGVKIRDQQITNLIRKTACQVCDETNEGMLKQHFKKEVKGLLNKKMVFKLKILKSNFENGNQTYEVLNVSDNYKLISKFVKVDSSDEESTISFVEDDDEYVKTLNTFGSSMSKKRSFEMMQNP